MFQINDYLTSFIDKCFKKVLDMLHTTKPTLPMAEKKSLPFNFFTIQNQNKEFYE